MLLSVTVSEQNERGPSGARHVLETLHQANPHRKPIQLILGESNAGKGLLLEVPDELAGIARNQLATMYPDATVEDAAAAAVNDPSGRVTWSAELRVHRDLYPIRRYSEFLDADRSQFVDPVSNLLDAIPAGRNKQLRATVRIEIRPCRPRCRRYYQTVLLKLGCDRFQNSLRLIALYDRLSLSRNRFCRFTGMMLSLGAKGQLTPESLTSTGRTHERESHRHAAADKLNQMLFETQIHIDVTAPEAAEAAAHRRLREIAGVFAVFSVPARATIQIDRIRRGNARRHGHSLLSAEELATLWHPPTNSGRPSRVATTGFQQLEPPADLPTPGNDKGIATLGRVLFRDRREVFGIREEDRLRHLFVVGKTGMGKSTLLWNLLAADFRAGRGVCLIDPHGDLAESLVRIIPRRRKNDLVVFDAGNLSEAPGYNPLECRSTNLQQRALTASGVLSCFRKAFDLENAPRLEHILRNCLLALMEQPGATLVDIQRLLIDGSYRKSVTARLANTAVRDFWQSEFAGWTDRYRNEALPAVQNKLGPFLSSPILHAIVSQQKSAFQFRRIMDEQQILIVNLSKGRIGEDASSLLGSFLVTGLQLAAMSRADVPEDERRPFYACVDEFQNFATESFATILSEARKYRLSLSCACQYLAQMPDSTAAAVFGNIGTLLCFQTGADDAEALALQLGSRVNSSDLTRLPKYTACLRLLVDGMPSPAFSMQTLKPQGESRAQPSDS